MPKITIKEAAELTGKSRRTIQRHISTGKLSYTDRSDGTRMLYDSEVVASFGCKEVNVTTVTHDTSHNVTPPDQEQIAALMQSLQLAIIESQAPLLAQIAELTSKLDELTNRIELTPDPVVKEDTVVIDEDCDDEQDIPAFLRKPRSAKKAPVVEFPTRNSTNDEIPGPDELDDNAESKYLKIPVFGED